MPEASLYGGVEAKEYYVLVKTIEAIPAADLKNTVSEEVYTDEYIKRKGAEFKLYEIGYIGQLNQSFDYISHGEVIKNFIEADDGFIITKDLVNKTVTIEVSEFWWNSLCKQG